jgi:conjugal transfer pilus assembly protein TrbC
MFNTHRSMSALATACWVLLWPGHAAAQQSSLAPAPAMRMPTAVDIDAARAKLSSQRDIEAAIANQNNVVPRVPSSATDTNAQQGLDLSVLAQQYEQIQRGPRGRTGDDESAERQAKGLVVFVSLGMPQASLERLVADAERARALLVLRGMHDSSLQKTKLAIQNLLGKRQVAFQIDPTLFTKFAVTGVPTFVLIDPARPVLVACGAAQCQQPAFSKVAGDVTMAFALDKVRTLDPTFSELASRFAARLSVPK